MESYCEDCGVEMEDDGSRQCAQCNAMWWPVEKVVEKLAEEKK